MKKFDFKIWENKDDNELPLFVDTRNLFIPNKNYVDIIDVVMITKHLRLDSIIFEKYGGFTNIEQFNVIKVILPLVLLFNDINDVSNLKIGTFIKIPEINTLIDNIYVYDENDLTIEDSLSFNNNEIKNLPGLNTINKYNVDIKNNIDETKTFGIPSIGITLDKVHYDNEKGLIIY